MYCCKATIIFSALCEIWCMLCLQWINDTETLWKETVWSGDNRRLRSVTNCQRKDFCRISNDSVTSLNKLWDIWIFVYGIFPIVESLASWRAKWDVNWKLPTHAFVMYLETRMSGLKMSAFYRKLSKMVNFCLNGVKGMHLYVNHVVFTPKVKYFEKEAFLFFVVGILSL